MVALDGSFFHHEGNGDAGLDAEDVMFRAGQLRICAHVATEIDDINLSEILRNAAPKTVEGAAINKAAVGDEGQQ